MFIESKEVKYSCSSRKPRYPPCRQNNSAPAGVKGTVLTLGALNDQLLKCKGDKSI